MRYRQNQKINIKDLINIGLFSVMIGVLTMIGGMIGFIPILMPAVTFVAGVLTGPVYMLFGTKIHKTGLLMIQQMISALMFVATGHGLFVIPTAIAGGIIGELCLRRGGYSSVKWMRLAFTGASISLAGNWIPVYFMREAFAKQMLDSGYGKEFADQMLGVLPGWTFPVMIAAGALGMYLGCTIGIVMLKKHFVKAGMVHGV